MITVTLRASQNYLLFIICMINLNLNLIPIKSFCCFSDFSTSGFKSDYTFKVSIFSFPILEATDSLDAEKIDNSLDTSSTMELKVS